MKKLVLTLALLIGLNSMAFGWATIVSGIKGGDTINFASNVSGVEVYLNDVRVGTIGDSNFSIKLKRSKEDQVFKFAKAGYPQQTITLSKKRDTLYWANIVYGGSIGSSVDSWTTGADMQYSPNYYYIEM